MTSNQNIKKEFRGDLLEKEGKLVSVINDIPTEHFDLARIFTIVVVENILKIISN